MQPRGKWLSRSVWQEFSVCMELEEITLSVFFWPFVWWLSGSCDTSFWSHFPLECNAYQLQSTKWFIQLSAYKLHLIFLLIWNSIRCIASIMAITYHNGFRFIYFFIFVSVHLNTSISIISMYEHICSNVAI